MCKNRTFHLTLKLVTDLNPKELEALTIPDVRRWLKEQFYGCDLGEVQIIDVTEQAPEG